MLLTNRQNYSNLINVPYNPALDVKWYLLHLTGVLYNNIWNIVWLWPGWGGCWGVTMTIHTLLTDYPKTIQIHNRWSPIKKTLVFQFLHIFKLLSQKLPKKIHNTFWLYFLMFTSCVMISNSTNNSFKFLGKKGFKLLNAYKACRVMSVMITVLWEVQTKMALSEIGRVPRKDWNSR